MYQPSPGEIAAAEAHIDLVDSTFREHYQEAGMIVPAASDAGFSDLIEVNTFAFGLMAGILRSSRALVILSKAGFNVESRPIFRSLLDQVLALYSVKNRGVHAVHAYGKQLANNYERLLNASENALRLGDSDRQWIQMIVQLSSQLPPSSEGKAAENAVKTYEAGQANGEIGHAVYQMWLEATPLSKPSMKLSDMYINVIPKGEGFQIRLHFDSDSESVVDPRLVIASVMPTALVVYCDIVGDPKLGLKAIRLAESIPRPNSTTGK